MTALRDRMIRELELHRKAPKTVQAYLSAVTQLAQHDHREPERISEEEIRDFLHHLITRRRVSYSTCNQKLAGIRFFYRHVLGQENFALRVPEALGKTARTAQPRRDRPVARGGCQPQASTRCRELLGAAAVAVDESSKSRTTADWMLSLGIDITRCPCCGDVLHREVVPPQSTRVVVAAAPSAAVVSFTPWDTS